MARSIQEKNIKKTNKTTVQAVSFLVCVGMNISDTRKTKNLENQNSAEAVRLRASAHTPQSKGSPEIPAATVTQDKPQTDDGDEPEAKSAEHYREQNQSNKVWQCSVCTFENPSSRGVCEMCQTAKPKSDAKPQAQVEVQHEDSKFNCFACGHGKEKFSAKCGNSNCGISVDYEQVPEFKNPVLAKEIMDLALQMENKMSEKDKKLVTQMLKAGFESLCGSIYKYLQAAPLTRTPICPVMGRETLKQLQVQEQHIPIKQRVHYFQICICNQMVRNYEEKPLENASLLQQALDQNQHVSKNMIQTMGRLQATAQVQLDVRLFTSEGLKHQQEEQAKGKQSDDDYNTHGISGWTDEESDDEDLWPTQEEGSSQEEGVC